MARVLFGLKRKDAQNTKITLSPDKGPSRPVNLTEPSARFGYFELGHHPASEAFWMASNSSQRANTSNVSASIASSRASRTGTWSAAFA